MSISLPAPTPGTMRDSLEFLSPLSKLQVSLRASGGVVAGVVMVKQQAGVEAA